MRLIFQRDVDGASGDVYFMRLAGLSTETKPTENVATGSIFIEVDTDKKYVYDEQTATWTQQSGSSVTPEVIEDAVEDYLDDHPEAVIDPQFVVNFTTSVSESNTFSASCDKTYSEILAAYNAHKNIVGYCAIPNGVTLELNFSMLTQPDPNGKSGEGLEIIYILTFIGYFNIDTMPSIRMSFVKATPDLSDWDVFITSSLEADMNVDGPFSFFACDMAIRRVGDPDYDTDAANKRYVDNASQVKVLDRTVVSQNEFTLNPCPITYEFGTRSLLTVTMSEPSHYHFSFISPVGTPTVLTMNGVAWTSGDEIEADKYYEVDVWNAVALIKAIDRTTYVGSGGAGGTGT